MLIETRIREYVLSGTIYKDSEATVLAKFHIIKARHNFLVSRLMFELSNNTKYKKALPIISNDFICYDWVISSSYYAMFHASTAALGAIGLKARGHEALIHALEYHLVYKRKALKTEDIKKLRNARNLERKYISSLWSAKTARNIAHYDIGKVFSEKEARNLIQATSKFLDRIEEFLNEI